MSAQESWGGVPEMGWAFRGGALLTPARCWWGFPEPQEASGVLEVLEEVWGPGFLTMAQGPALLEPQAQGHVGIQHTSVVPLGGSAGTWSPPPPSATLRSHVEGDVLQNSSPPCISFGAGSLPSADPSSHTASGR